MSKPILIKNYKGVDIFYGERDGRLYFEFEGERQVKYIFEAEAIIDEPKWKKCSMVGLYLDYSLDYHIGTAKAERINIKTNRPDWKYKGKYDMSYRQPQSFGEDKTAVYPANAETKKIYQDWKTQHELAVTENNRANVFAVKLKEIEPIDG